MRFRLPPAGVISFVAKIFYVHWDEAEAKALAASLQSAGHQVRLHFKMGANPALGDFAADALVVSLDRLPSHGKQMAEWFRKAKARRKRPIIFVGGLPEKVSLTRGFFPNSVFCEHSQAAEAVGRLFSSI